jgi:hypothetical protein
MSRGTRKKGGDGFEIQWEKFKDEGKFKISEVKLTQKIN